MASIVEIVSYYNDAKQQAIVYHHQTNNFSEHKALEEFYEEIVGLLDDLSESYAGIYGRLTPYEAGDLFDWVSTEETIKYYKGCYDWLQKERQSAPQDSFIQNQLDEITQANAKLLYRLSLK